MHRAGILALLLIGLCAGPVLAIDVDPSEKKAPRSSYDPVGPKVNFLPQLSDPKRIERANALDLKSLEPQVKADPNPLSLQALAAKGTGAGLQVTFTIHNKGKRTVNLLFPSAQRYDLVLRTAKGEPLYTWSADKAFEQGTGASTINPDDSLIYTETILLSDIKNGLAPGAYTLEAILANYPTITAKVGLEVRP